MAGNKSALLAVPWLGIFTGLLGNLSLLSYFAKKKEKEAILVQTLGVISMYVVISQLALAEAMPWPYFVATSVVVASGLVLNFMNYFNWLNFGVWRLWEDFITVGGLSVLPQVMWSTFIPAVPNSILPGSVAFVLAIGTVALIYRRDWANFQKKVSNLLDQYRGGLQRCFSCGCQWHRCGLAFSIQRTLKDCLLSQCC
ncbi:hypothetical protein Syun_017974 [Stephania yunnanensis]|uniref:Maltose excess protein 1-like, chloroplastic n=1 Tax=Stephania yunnanensis TaxID=152371 RepID=A0AAP0IRF6_9MAGN